MFAVEPAILSVIGRRAIFLSPSRDPTDNDEILRWVSGRMEAKWRKGGSRGLMPGDVRRVGFRGIRIIEGIWVRLRLILLVYAQSEGMRKWKLPRSKICPYEA